MIKTECCKASFSKEEYMKILIENKILFPKCVCGDTQDRASLRKYFTDKEIDSVLNKDHFKSLPQCIICKKDVGESNYRCKCDAVMHLNCSEFSFSCNRCNRPIEVRTECCNKSISKESYSQMIIQKSSANKTYSSLYARCICDKQLDKLTLKKWFNESDIDNMHSQIQYIHNKESANLKSIDLMISSGERKAVIKEDKGKRSCNVCLSEIVEKEEYKCECGARMHTKCKGTFVICQGCKKAIKMYESNISHNKTEHKANVEVLLKEDKTEVKKVEAKDKGKVVLGKPNIIMEKKEVKKEVKKLEEVPKTTKELERIKEEPIVNTASKGKEEEKSKAVNVNKAESKVVINEKVEATVTNKHVNDNVINSKDKSVLTSTVSDKSQNNKPPEVKIDIEIKREVSTNAERIDKKADDLTNQIIETTNKRKEESKDNKTQEDIKKTIKEDKKEIVEKTTTEVINKAKEETKKAEKTTKEVIKKTKEKIISKRREEHKEAKDVIDKPKDVIDKAKDVTEKPKKSIEKTKEILEKANIEKANIEKANIEKANIEKVNIEKAKEITEKAKEVTSKAKEEEKKTDKNVKELKEENVEEVHKEAKRESKKEIVNKVEEESKDKKEAKVKKSEETKEENKVTVSKSVISNDEKTDNKQTEGVNNRGVKSNEAEKKDKTIEKNNTKPKDINIKATNDEARRVEEKDNKLGDKGIRDNDTEVKKNSNKVLEENKKLKESTKQLNNNEPRKAQSAIIQAVQKPHMKNSTQGKYIKATNTQPANYNKEPINKAINKNIEEQKAKEVVTGSKKGKQDTKEVKEPTLKTIQYIPSCRSKCIYCNTEKKGYCIHLCTDKFVCETCILKKEIAKIYSSGIHNFCHTCKSPINLQFIKFLNGRADSHLKKVIKDWEEKNTR